MIRLLAIWCRWRHCRVGDHTVERGPLSDRCIISGCRAYGPPMWWA